MTRPRLLDLFCGAGGTTKGYQSAGFYVVGVDIAPQPNYCGDEFVQADAVAVLNDYINRPVVAGHRHRLLASGGVRFDAIHASPPCQFYSHMSACRPDLAARYPDLIGPVRDRLAAIGLPYVIENVPGSPLRHPTLLCGAMFDLDLYRHRLFETSFPLSLVMHPGHGIKGGRAGHWNEGEIISVAGHVNNVAEARRAMGIDWMTRDELAEAIPPAYTEWIGAHLLAAIETAA